MKLWTTETYNDMGWEAIAAIANGCGPTDCKWCAFFLDNALGLYVFDACAQHDVDYEIGGNKQAKVEADIRFVCNLIVIALSKPSLKNLIRIPYLFIYYVAVHFSGNQHFYWHEPDD